MLSSTNSYIIAVAWDHTTCQRPSRFSYEVGMPVPLARHPLPVDHDLELRLVANHSSAVVQADVNRLGLPHDVVERAGRNAAQVLLFRHGLSTGIYQLEVVSAYSGPS